MKRSPVVERMEVQPDSIFYHEHVARYRFAETYLQPGWTLDIACGTGYGSERLSRRPGIRLAGADVDLPSLVQALRQFPQPRISFLAASGTGLPFPDGRFHNVVSLETIEHIRDHRGYLRELGRVLNTGGACIISTPNREYSERHNRTNPYHVREYAESELRGLLQEHFASVEMFYQGFGASYHDRVRDYSASIQHEKERVNRFVRFGIDRIYRPLKRVIPFGIANLFIRRLLRLQFPQPAISDISIAPEPQEDSSVFIAVCRKNLRP